MARGKRRDDWDRFGQLIAKVHNRTIWDSSDKPMQPTDCWPDSLVDDDEIKTMNEAPAVPRVSMTEVLQRMGLKK